MRMHFLVHVAIRAVLWAVPAASASDIVLPADQDLTARRIHELCSALDLPPKPSYAEAHEAFKKRLGDYYARYQNSLYEMWKQSLSPEQYEKARAAADKMVEDGIEEAKKESGSSEATLPRGDHGFKRSGN